MTRACSFLGTTLRPRAHFTCGEHARTATDFSTRHCAQPPPASAPAVARRTPCPRWRDLPNAKHPRREWRAARARLHEAYTRAAERRVKCLPVVLKKERLVLCDWDFDQECTQRTTGVHTVFAPTLRLLHDDCLLRSGFWVGLLHASRSGERDPQSVFEPSRPSVSPFVRPSCLKNCV